MLDSLAPCLSSLAISERFNEVRGQTETLALPLSEADAQLQSMPDASPAKWHLAHTTWFFEAFILGRFIKDYRPFNPSYNYLFNSYYNGIGEQYPRHQRGLISRPSLREVLEYRRNITTQISALLEVNTSAELVSLVELGLQHEQQHQELLLTDIKHAFFHNPSYPRYCSSPELPLNPVGNPESTWLHIDGGLVTIGADTNMGFSFDNERPLHRVYCQPFCLQASLVSNQDYLHFIEDGAYQRPEFWLADGWAWLQKNRVQQPLYWIKQDGQWFEFSLYGLLPLNMQQSAIHLNYYEASAYAVWAGARLPTEFEWETAVKHHQKMPIAAAVSYHPAASDGAGLQHVFGTAWQWTSSSYSAYPGFKPFAGVAGEYNGKFMSNQFVLRGSSCVTPKGHARYSYRNFFYAPQSWQFSGIRLAKDES